MKRGLAGLLALFVLLLAASALLARLMPGRLDPATLTARVANDLRRATGRTIAYGPLHVTLFPALSIEADGVSLANPPGFSRPQMFTATHLRMRVALLPLLARRVVITDVELTGADLRLERRADGTPNWRFTPPPPPPRPVSTLATSSTPHRPDRITLLRLSLADATLAYADTATSATLAVPSLTLAEVNPSSTIHLDGTLMLGGERALLTAGLGAQTHLWNEADRTPWPVNLSLAAASGNATLSGTLTNPLAFSGYDLSITAAGDDIFRLLQGLSLPPLPRLRAARLDTRLIDRPDGLDMPHLALAAGPSDLSATLPGLSLASLKVDAPNIDGTNAQTNRVAVSGQYVGQALSLAVSFGPVGRLLRKGSAQALSRAPIRIDLSAAAAGATLSAKGQVQPSGNWSGTALAVQAAVPSLAALAPLARRPLPPWNSLALQAQLASAGGALTLHGAHLQSPAIDVAIEGSARLSGRPDFTGSITVAHADLDAVLAALTSSPAGVPSPAAPPSPAPEAPLLPADPLPFARLAAADADLSLSAGTLLWHGQTAGPLTAHVKLQDSRLIIDPFSFRFAGAPVTATFSVDAHSANPAVALVAHAEGIDLALLGDSASGILAAGLALAGTGTSVRGLLSHAEGSFGLAITNAALPNRLFAPILTRLLPAAALAIHLPRTGKTGVTCLASRIDVMDGIGVVRAFQLDLDQLHLSAAGGIDFGRETLDLRLRPTVRLGPAALVLPSRAQGSWQSPSLSLEPASGASTGAVLAAGLLASHGISGLLVGTGGADELLVDADSGNCNHALALAKDFAKLPPQLATPQPQQTAPTVRQRAIDLLRRLFRRS